MKLHLERKIKGENHFDKAKAFECDLSGIKWHRGFFSISKSILFQCYIYRNISVRTAEARMKCCDYPNM